MAGFTKKAIKDTFIQLLDEKPYNQITVKDLVETCGINRNSFYYHYSDLPALVEEIIQDELDRISTAPISISSVLESLSTALSFAKEHRRAVYHLYKSINRERFEQYLMNICENTITRYVDQLFEGFELSEGNRRLIINYYKYLCFGATIDWLESGMTLDIEGDFARICELMVDPVVKDTALRDLLSTGSAKLGTARLLS